MRQQDVAEKQGAGLLALAAIASLTIALALLPSPAHASPGWDLILDRPTPNFSGIDFPTPDEGWLVAGAGLLHSTDGGATWTEAATLSGIDVDFADADHGWLVGRDGMIWATADGGETWQEQDSGLRHSPIYFPDVEAISATEAWAVGLEDQSDTPHFPVGTALLHTTDGGGTWQQVELPSNMSFNKIITLGTSGWLLGSECPTDPGAAFCNGSMRSVILHTGDGGATWTPLETDLPDTLRDLSFVDDAHGWAIGEGCAIPDAGCSKAIYRTSDGGSSWEPIEVSQFGSPSQVQFTDASTGWAIAQLCDARCLVNILQSSDGGASWTNLSTIDLAPFQYASTFAVQNGGFYLTGVDVALRSNTGGMSWQEMDTPALALDSVDFVDQRVGFAVSGRLLVRSDDAGASWERVGPAPGYTRIIDFLDASTGFAATNSCGRACGPDIERTTDGGRTWTTVHHSTQGGLQRSVQFVDRRHGWVVTEHTFFVTEDGGNTWQERPLPGDVGETIYQADLATATDGWALVAGGAPFARTTDAGRSWEAVPAAAAEPASIEFVDFVDGEHGWYTTTDCSDTCGSTIYGTADGGQTWAASEIRSSRIYDLVFVDPANGWLSATNCAGSCTFDVFHSSDAGRSWTSQLSSDAVPNEFDFVDVRHGWFTAPAACSLGLGCGFPQRTLLYRTTDAGGGPIGVLPTPLPKFPDVGTGPASARSSGLMPIALLLGAGAVALGAGAFVARRR